MNVSRAVAWTALFLFALAGVPIDAWADDHLAITPTLGISTGDFGGVRVQHIDLGIDLAWPAYFAIESRLQLGRTENGLGQDRVEIGGDLRLPSGPFFRLGLGPHLAYGMLLRATHHGSLFDALIGNIGAPGIGAHADVALLLPISKSISLDFGGRFTGDAYVGMTAWSVGPELGMTFQ